MGRSATDVVVDITVGLVAIAFWLTVLYLMFATVTGLDPIGIDTDPRASNDGPAAIEQDCNFRVGETC